MARENQETKPAAAKPPTDPLTEPWAQAIDGTPYDVPELRPILADWAAHVHHETGKPLSAVRMKTQLLNFHREGWEPKRLAAAIRLSVANGWRSIYESKDAANGKSKYPAPKEPNRKKEQPNVEK